MSKEISLTGHAESLFQALDKKGTFAYVFENIPLPNSPSLTKRQRDVLETRLRCENFLLTTFISQMDLKGVKTITEQAHLIPEFLQFCKEDSNPRKKIIHAAKQEITLESLRLRALDEIEDISGKPASSQDTLDVLRKTVSVIELALELKPSQA